MKVNKVSHYIYGFLMLMPLMSACGMWLYCIFTRTGTIDNPIYQFASGFSNVMYNGSFDFVEGMPFYESINDFCELFGVGFTSQLGIDYYFTYIVTISVVYLGIEVLLAFINIARKLVYAFVDKEF